ncbi:hypothetical protein C8R32_101362 [Nitrosospira sp. Nsp5]|uniref:Uncharacterized protein n=1 Tax=Nitrosospira multiformis TaxID=1231 RepID=A0ABY0TFF5_9PROT|nr:MULTISPECIES: hypothetical protein [Nitrosospira]PTR10832.1 hypothetical protein C8R32_101362 [Nitrosospira sp. Nsp5]SDQ73942.1 hypothetical protein SAMN05216402_2093 [Nitrosospira multiformis]
MRYLVAVLFLASCTIFTPAPIDDHAVEQSTPPVANPVKTPEANPEASESRAEGRKLKPRPVAPSTSDVSPCANLDAGDLKATIKAKLDCLQENAK